MKTIFTLEAKKQCKKLSIAVLMLVSVTAKAQITTVCTSPTTVAYGLTGNGEIYEINNTTGATIRVIKNNTYAGNSPSRANGIGYNSFNSRFYYFKRNVTSSPQEFVSFTPTTNTVSILASSTCTDEVHTGCINASGTGYYAIDVQGTMHYYDIATNKWTFITSKIIDQNGNDVTSLIKTQSAGDLAIDAWGNLWLLTSSSSNYGLYKFPANLPTTAVAQVDVVCWINPTAVTPTGNSFAGIAFKPNGQILMSTKNDNRLYLLQNISTLTFIGNLTTSDVGNDLTACVFPAAILPVVWKSFDVTVQNNNNVTLDWEVSEYQNKGFNVQQSINGSDWVNIAFVPANNDPSKTQSYSYSHQNNLNGKQYYRIQQVDLDNRVSYSEIKMVTLKNEKQNITVFPNPVSDQIRILGNNGNINLSKAKIFDLSGRMIAEKKLQANSATIIINDIPSGTYVIRVESVDGTVYNQKIIKQ